MRTHTHYRFDKKITFLYAEELMIRNDRELEIQFPNSHIILIKNRTALLFCQLILKLLFIISFHILEYEEPILIISMRIIQH